MTPPNSLRPHLPAVAVAVIYTGIATAVAAVRGNHEFVFYIAVMAILMATIGVVHRKVGLSKGAVWCLCAWGALHMAGGLVPVPDSWPIEGSIRVLYSAWLVPDLLKYDHVVHAFGFGVTTWICWQTWRSMASGVRPTFGPLFLCAVAGMGFGAMNEIVEFAATLLVEETNVGGYQNTGWDLVSNAVGATIAALAIRLSSPAEP